MDKYALFKKLAVIFYKNYTKINGWQEINTDYNDDVYSFVMEFDKFKTKTNKVINEPLFDISTEEILNQKIENIVNLKNEWTNLMNIYNLLEEKFFLKYGNDYSELNASNSDFLRDFLKDYFAYTSMKTNYHSLSVFEDEINKCQKDYAKLKSKFNNNQPQNV